MRGSPRSGKKRAFTDPNLSHGTRKFQEGKFNNLQRCRQCQEESYAGIKLQYEDFICKHCLMQYRVERNRKYHVSTNLMDPLSTQVKE